MKPIELALFVGYIILFVDNILIKLEMNRRFKCFAKSIMTLQIVALTYIDEDREDDED